MLLVTTQALSSMPIEPGIRNPSSFSARAAAVPQSGSEAGERRKSSGPSSTPTARLHGYHGRQPTELKRAGQRLLLRTQASEKVLLEHTEGQLPCGSHVEQRP